MPFNADLLYNKYKGRSLSFDGIPANQGQCVQWAEYVLTDKQYGYGKAPFYGNAIDWWNKYSGSLKAFDKLTDGTIRKGDIVIFNQKVGSVYGHIDMAMKDGNYDYFQGADSNWAGNKTVHLVNHYGRQYIQGVLRLRSMSTSNLTLAEADELYLLAFNRHIDKAGIKATVGKPLVPQGERLRKSKEYKKGRKAS